MVFLQIGHFHGREGKQRAELASDLTPDFQDGV